MPLTRAKFLKQALLASSAAAVGARSAAADAGVRKIKDVVIYGERRFYSAFPSIVRRPDGELLTAFRRAPDRRLNGAIGVRHTDPNSYLVLVRSRDNGETWDKEPSLIYAHPEAGSQDPCMVQLSDGTLLCTSYAWYQMPADSVRTEKSGPPFRFLGGYLVRSTDGGHTWGGPILPPPVPGRNITDPFGRQLPVYNRGAMCQGRDGRLYWVIHYGKDPGQLYGSDVHLMISADGGLTWTYSAPVATDNKVWFNEACMYETPAGDLVSFIRTDNFDDHTVVARSTDHGRSFAQWQDVGWQGHPHHAIRLPDNRVFLVYGYRHKPYGIRARILNPECTDVATAPEIVLRDDGGNGDLGYPWAVALPDRRILATYYFNNLNGTRYIGGTLLAY
jgi:sialidase-1